MTTDERLNPRARASQLNKFARQSQMYDGAALKPCRHTQLCEKHRRCISATKAVCPYRCQVCPDQERQHA